MPSAHTTGYFGLTNTKKLFSQRYYGHRLPLLALQTRMYHFIHTHTHSLNSAASFINHSHSPTNRDTNKTQFESTRSGNYCSVFHKLINFRSESSSLYTCRAPPSRSSCQNAIYPDVLILPRIRRPNYLSTGSTPLLADLRTMLLRMG